MSCHTGNLKFVSALPKILKEVSGIETTSKSDLIWTLTDGGNAPNIYGINKNGAIIKELKIKAKNNDWEDITSDKEGNLYIGDFGNNDNTRKNLTILKISKDSLNNSGKTTVERISFKYEDQAKFPPKKKQMYFDCEAFFHYNDSLYLFTKSRVNNNFGRTNLYKIPAKGGYHVAQLINSFTSGNDLHSWVTSADISNDGTQIVLLTQKSVIVFSNFTSNNFFSGNIKEFDFDYESQKEGICFKDINTLYITDEKAHGTGGNLYEFKLN